MSVLIKNTLKSLLCDKKNSILNLFGIALCVMIPLLVISLTMSFVGNSFVELEEISYVLHIYTTDTSNALYKLCGAVSVLTIILGSALLIALVLRITKKEEKKLKNYLFMGATFGQLAFLTFVKNIALFIVGFIVGVGLSYLFLFVVGICAKTTLSLMMDILLVVMLLYFAFVTIISVIVPVWTNTNKTL